MAMRLVLALWLLAFYQVSWAAAPPPKASPKPTPKPKASPPQSKGVCQDKSSSCKRFADLGYCTSRPVYMVGTAAAPGNCLATCKKCPIGTCHDTSPQCPQFAALGYCSSRPVYMIGTDTTPGNCLASCKSCIAAPPPSPAPSAALAKFYRPPDVGNATIRSLLNELTCVTPNPVGGRTLVMLACDGSVRQLWTWSKTAKTLVNAASRLCITYAGALAEGSAVNLQACVAGSKVQQWDYIPYTFTPLSPAANKAWCIRRDARDVWNTTTNAILKMGSSPEPQHGLGAAQRSIFNLYPAKCMDLSAQCPALSKQGRCQTDASYMVGDILHLGMCRKSCGVCPVQYPAPPRPPPSSNRPPRGGGAQGSCVQECNATAGYVRQSTFTDYVGQVYNGDLCVLPYVEYVRTNCAMLFAQRRLLAGVNLIETGGGVACDPCKPGYNPRASLDPNADPLNGMWLCVQLDAVAYMCGSTGSTLPPSPPPTPPPPPSPPRPFVCQDWCCLWNQNQPCDGVTWNNWNDAQG